MERIINIFIASSAEMKHERLELVDLILDINDEIESSNSKIEPVLWEYMDSSMGVKRKEDEYLGKLQKCQICLVLFWHSLGEYTKEELEFAISSSRNGKYPKKVYVLFKAPDDNITEELETYKKSLAIDYKEIPCLSFNGESDLRKIVIDIIESYTESN